MKDRIIPALAALLLAATLSSPARGGACCLPDDTCLDLPRGVCTLLLGVYLGEGSTCATSECDLGRCCFIALGGLPDCDDLTHAGCMDLGGLWDDDAQCAGAACPPLVADVDLVALAEPEAICVGDRTQVAHEYHVSNPGTLTLVLVTVADNACHPVARGPDILGNNDGFLEPGEVWSFGCTTTISGSATSTATVTAVAAGTAQVVQATDSVTVTAVIPPDCFIDGPTSVVEGATAVFTGPPDLGSYIWTITGNASFAGPSFGEAITILAGPPGSFEISLTVEEAPGCAASCAQLVTVVPPADGACCLPGGVCESFDEAECAALEGFFQGAGRDCANLVCADAPFAFFLPPGGTTIPLPRFDDLGGTRVLQEVMLSFRGTFSFDAELTNLSGGQIIFDTTITYEASAETTLGPAPPVSVAVLESFDCGPGVILGPGQSCDFGGTRSFAAAGSSLLAAPADLTAFIGPGTIPAGIAAQGDFFYGGAVPFQLAVSFHQLAGTVGVGYQFTTIGGACCLPGGACAETAPADCAAQAGIFQGEGTDCASLPCPAPPIVQIAKTGAPATVCEGHGAPVTYSYLVSNPGQAALTDVEVIDDTCPVVTRGPDAPGDGDDLLEPGETWTYSCTTMVFTTTTNVATVTAQHVQTGEPAVAQAEFTVVATAPECEITGPGAVCPGTNGILYTIAETGGAPGPTFVWTISGAGSFCGGGATATGPAVCVNAGLVCGGAFTLVATVTSADGCATACLFFVQVEDDTAPIIVCPPNLVVECEDGVPPPDPASVVAMDDCPAGAMIVHLGDVANGACPVTIARTYRAIDACGNSSDCVQIITVVDTTPPLITCPPDVTIDCGEPPDPGATGTAVAIDNCDPAPAITFDDFIPHGDPGELVIQRTWIAIDACGNTAQCLQVITVECPCTGVIGDFIWLDQDGDGIQDPGEPGIPGVTVALIGDFPPVEGGFAAEAVTDANGIYQFTDLCAGEYLVVVDSASLPPGLVETAPNQGPNDELDSDCVDGGVAVTLPADDAVDLGIDCGFASAAGACCFANGLCAELTGPSCAIAGGAFQGLGSACAEGLCCPAPQFAQAKLPGSTSGAALLGAAVALDGDTAVVGAPGAAAGDAGSASVYRADGGGWVEEAVLEAPPGAARFGHAVALRGDVLIVGAPEAGGDHSGSAYVFVFDGESWAPEATLVASGTRPGDRFGWSVALDGDVAVVGTGGADPGAAYVFRFDGSAWAEEAELLPSASQPGDAFGRAVAVRGHLALVGAPGGGAGAAHVFRFEEGAWSEAQVLAPLDPAPGMAFGAAVALDLGVALVGAPDASGPDPGAGAAYAFLFDGATWTPGITLLPPCCGGRFGASVAVKGDRALVGAPDAVIDGAARGAVHAYGAAWTPLAPLLADDGGAADRFGAAVALGHDGSMLVGAPGDDDRGADSGAPYAFAGDDQDCNGNGVVDECDIATGTSADEDADGTPDECECRPPDVPIGGACVELCNETVVCDPEGSGSSIYTFELRNLSGVAVHWVFFVPPPGVSIEPTTIHLAQPIPDGETGPVPPVTITTSTPGTAQDVCFTLIMLDQTIQECCTAGYCIALESCCASIANETIACAPPGAGDIVDTFTLVNLTDQVVEHMFVVDPSDTLTIEPDYFPLTATPVPPGGSVTRSVTLTAVGGSPLGAGALCVVISIHDAAIVECCSIEQCFAVPACAAACPCDLDGDGAVGFADLSEMLNHWGPCPPGGCPGDVTGTPEGLPDGQIGFADLSEMLAQWGACP